jgi:protein-tyrosine phosphatase
MTGMNDGRDRRSGSGLRWFAKSVVPKRVLKEVLEYRRYRPHERPLYLKLRLANGLRLANLRTRKAPEAARSFLFVCFGNIMRSPMCEALMKEAIGNSRPTVRALSAGLHATPGRPAHPWSISAARAFGVDLSRHRARRLNPEALDQADVIFAMDYRNLVELLCRYPWVKEKVYMLSAYAEEGYRSIEIQDPFFGDEAETRRCYTILKRCIDNLVATLPADETWDLSLILKNLASTGGLGGER